MGEQCKHEWWPVYGSHDAKCELCGRTVVWSSLVEAYTERDQARAWAAAWKRHAKRAWACRHWLRGVCQERDTAQQRVRELEQQVIRQAEEMAKAMTAVDGYGNEYCIVCKRLAWFGHTDGCQVLCALRAGGEGEQ